MIRLDLTPFIKPTGIYLYQSMKMGLLWQPYKRPNAVAE
jgi:hypothetical protein